jgi:bacillithiol biosynthesis deacetylase BshB1
MADASLDVLAFAAHPDDVEFFAGGTVALLVSQGYRVGIADLTRGELGSRGTAEIREREAAEAAAILGVDARVNLGLPDGDIRNTLENRVEVARVLRAFRPRILLVPAPDCRHPDHPAAARLVTEAVFPAGLRRVETAAGAEPLEPWRPHHVLHYMQSIPFEPTLVVDVTPVWETRLRALRAFASQVHRADYAAPPGEPETFISNPAFVDWIEARARTYGYRIGATYGEPLLYRHGPIGVTDLVRCLERDLPVR